MRVTLIPIAAIEIDGALTGSPLINAGGDVVGVNTAAATPNVAVPAGAGLAIPVDARDARCS